MKKMKKIIFIFLFLFTTSFSFSQEWLNDINEALKDSKNNDLPIFMVFSGSDWCNNCIKLKKNVFESSKFKEFALQNLILLLVDFPRNTDKLSTSQIKKNEDLANEYNEEGIFPKMLLLNNKKKVIKTIYFDNQSIDELIKELKIN